MKKNTVRIRPGNDKVDYQKTVYYVKTICSVFG